MRKIGLMIFICLLACSADAFAKRPKTRAPEIKRDEIIYVTEWRYVRVVNLASIAKEFSKWQYGDECAINGGGMAQVLGVVGDKVLLLYVVDDDSFGCANGVMFFVSRQEYLRMKASYEKKLRAEQAEKELVRKILDAKQWSPALKPQRTKGGAR
ncbi:MAG: hypothetical protein AAB731_02665 [Patescibacteria group bacterium]